MVKNYRTAAKSILLAGFTAGVADILAAFILYAFILGKTTPTKILQSITSGISGKEAYTGGMATAIYGLLIHFFIALCFAGGYYLVYQHFSYLKKDPVVSGLLYGIVVWLVMNLLILPLTFGYTPSVNVDSIPGILIVMICVGLPISLIIHYYATKQKKQPQ